MTDQEINEAVARKLGYCTENHSLSCKKAYWSEQLGPDFCHSIAAAWEVVEWLHDKGDQNKPDSIPYGFRLEHHTENSEDKWVCELPNVTWAPPYEEMNSDITVEADTAPMAICLAFLKMGAE